MPQDPTTLPESSFERLSITDPAALVALLAALRPAQLTFALEHLGANAPNEIAVPALIAHMSHASALVREGALIGADYCTRDSRIAGALAEVAASDPNDGLRKEAQGLLDEITQWGPYEKD